jgi:FtsX extracellular domain
MINPHRAAGQRCQSGRMDENDAPAPRPPGALRSRMIWLIAAAVLVLGAGAATMFLVTRDDDTPAARPWVPPKDESLFNNDFEEYGAPEIQRHCLDPGGRQTVITYFKGTDPDPVMREAARTLEGDDRIASVATETQQEAYERFKVLFANQPELVELARPQALPASVTLLPADGVYAGDLADALTNEFPEIESVGAGCELPE